MSLIFEALKKLDREKQVPERGFVVVAQPPWPESGKRRLVRLALASGLVLLFGFLAFALLRSNTPGGGTGARVESAAAALPSGATVPKSVQSKAATAESPVVAPLAPAQGAAPVPDPASASASDRTRPAAAEHKTPSAPSAVRGSQPPADPVRAAAPGPTPPARTASATAGAAATPIWERPAAPREEPQPSRSGAEASPTQIASPARNKTPGDTALQLQAITEQDGHPVAMVNGRLVKEGDSFDGVKILRIQPTEVEIEVEGRRRVLSF